MSAQAGYSIKAWCKGAGFSEALYYKRKRLRLTCPHEVKVDRRTIIIESPPDYLSRLAREQAAAERPQLTGII
jgi:hypothetical protein